MTEQEYKDAANLIRVRNAYAILKDMAPMIESHEAMRRECLQQLFLLEARLTKLVGVE